MFQFTQRRLARKSKLFRYAFFIISSVQLKSFRSWTKEGEPNPFVAKTYRHKQSRRVEFDDIFDDYAKDGSYKR